MNMKETLSIFALLIATALVLTFTIPPTNQAQAVSEEFRIATVCEAGHVFVVALTVGPRDRDIDVVQVYRTNSNNYSVPLKCSEID